MADHDQLVLGYQQRFKVVATNDSGQSVIVPYVIPADASGYPNDSTHPLYTSNIAAVSETPRGYSQITSLSSAATIGSVPASSTKAVIQAYGQAVRWRDDGTSPTTTVGMLMQPGDTLIYDGTLTAIKFIELAASAKLDVSFY